MEINREKNKIKFEGVENEDIVGELRDFLTEIGGEKKLKVNLTECEDLHTAVVQLLGAYKVIYDIEFIFAEENSSYKMALESFGVCENNLN